jgi:hypothetical protein
VINYTTYTAQISNLMAELSSDPNFQTMLPGMIDYAEQRLYRELDLIYTRVTDATGSCTAGNNLFQLPTSIGTFLVVEQVNVFVSSISGVGTATSVPLVNTSVDFIDLTYGSGSFVTNIPEFFAMRDNANILLGPTPISSFQIQIRGTQRPAALSASNSSTILTQMLPDAFIAASMVFGSGYMRDFGSQSDNPQMAQSWEGQYTKLMQSANVEELRKKYQSQGWTNQIPSPIATPPRA